MKVSIYDNLADFQQATPPEFSDEISNRVREIIGKVRGQGDKALKDLTGQFDGYREATLPKRVSESLSGKYGERPSFILEEAADNIRRFHQAKAAESDGI